MLGFCSANILPCLRHVVKENLVCADATLRVIALGEEGKREQRICTVSVTRKLGVIASLSPLMRQAGS